MSMGMLLFIVAGVALVEAGLIAWLWNILNFSREDVRVRREYMEAQDNLIAEQRQAFADSSVYIQTMSNLMRVQNQQLGELREKLALREQLLKRYEEV